MCRIAAIISPNSPQLATAIKRLCQAMQHGGPDGEGIFVDETKGMALGHRRLSLLDLTDAGSQPMQDASARYQIIYNGELYNFQTLKQELQQLGYRFQSHSDTEVVLYAFIAWGVEAFKRFNGMFALAIYDTHTSELCIARDEVGIKPLYIYQENKELIIASELRAFTAYDAQWPKAKDWELYFLAFGFIPEPLTQLQSVTALSPGTYQVFNQQAQCIRKGSFAQLHSSASITEECIAIADIRKSLSAAVQRQLVADAPIGVFLSGGIDSSILTAIASQYKQPLHTLSLAFEHSGLSEAPYQQAVADAYATQHTCYTLGADTFYEHLADIHKALDQPSNDGVNTYFISKYAKEQGLKTVLSGLGADEILGGYPSFKHAHRLQQIAKLPYFTLQIIQQFLSGDKWKRLSYLYAQRQQNIYLVNRGLFAPAQIADILNCSLQEVQAALNNIEDIAIDPHLPILEQNAWREFKGYMRNQLLRDADVMSMWHGVEIRVPFLDQEFLKLVWSIDPAIKYNSSKGKHLLIEAFKKELPTAVWDRAKQGFTLPFQQWMQAMPLHKESPSTTAYYKAFRQQQLHWSKLWVLEQLH
jgi:asparagine synthase (glutamine-hydrolysing)